MVPGVTAVLARRMGRQPDHRHVGLARVGEPFVGDDHGPSPTGRAPGDLAAQELGAHDGLLPATTAHDTSRHCDRSPGDRLGRLLLVLAGKAATVGADRVEAEERRHGRGRGAPAVVAVREPVCGHEGTQTGCQPEEQAVTESGALGIHRRLKLSAPASAGKYRGCVSQRRQRTVDVERLASAFSTPVFRALSENAPSVALDRLSFIADADPTDPDPTLGAAFDRAYARLALEYRNEYFFKTQLISKIVFGRHSPRTAAALVEVPMGSSCADLVIMNGTSTVYEVKTDLDDFTRLAGQVSDYSTRAEHVNVVVSDLRAAGAERHLAEHVGILAFTRRGSLRTVRPSVSRLETLEIDHLYQLLRGAEAEAILRRTLGYQLDVGSGLAWPRMREVFRQLPVDLAHNEVVAELRLRGRRTGALASVPSFPHSLRCLAYATAVSGKGASRILDRLSQPVMAFV